MRAVTAAIAFLASSPIGRGAWRAHLCALLLALQLAPVTASQQAPADDQQAPPIFRAEIRYVEVDVFVTDRDGAFVRDLTQDDFELYDDGDRQDLSTFTLVDLPIVSRVSQQITGGLVDADVTTNAADGRIYVLLLDGGSDAAHVMQGQRLARRFVEESLGPDDVMAVLHAQGDQRRSQGFTNNRRLLLESIDRFGPAALQGAIADEDRAREMLNTYDVIKDLSERLGVVSGRRKAILWIGGDVPFEGRDPTPNPPPGVQPVTAIEQSLIHIGYRDAIRAATRNNVAVYPIDPRGLTAALGPAGVLRSAELERTAALRSFAEDTGGIAVVQTNNVTDGYERIVRDNSTYYLLGYYPTVDHRDGRFRPIRVRVTRPGLNLRARPGYFAHDPDAAARDLPPLPDGLSAVARDALRSPASVPGLTIDLLATPFKGGSHVGSVLLSAQLRGSDLRLDAGERIEFAYQAFDPDGRGRTGARKVFTLTFEPGSRAHVEESGLRFFDLLDLPAGRHEIRFVAHQPGGSTGSVVAHIDVPDFARGAVALSGIVLTSAGTASHRTLLGDPRMTDVAPAESAASAFVALPTPVREFPSDDALAVFAEVYVNARGAPQDVRVVATVTSGAGEVVFTDEQLPARSGALDDRLAYLGLVPLNGLASGRYVLTLEADEPGGRTPVNRQVPFTITPD